jgi:hypothetical protein
MSETQKENAIEGIYTGRYVFSITQSDLNERGYDLEACKHLLGQLQEVSKAVMMHAWEKGFHVELAEYISGLKRPQGGTNEKPN